MAMGTGPNNGVPFDEDQHALDVCNFSGCGRSTDDEPMLLVAYKGSVRAVCQVCFRMRLKMVLPG